MKIFIEKYFLFLLIPLISLLVSLTITKLAVFLLPKLGFVDEPDGGRRIHTSATPTSGGIAIFASFFLSWFIFLKAENSFFRGEFSNIDQYFKIFFPGLLLFCIGVIDDRFGMRARYKLFFQVAVASICFYSGFRINALLGVELGTLASFLCTIFWITAFVNAFNLIDGMDGLAAGLGVVSSLAMASVYLFSGSQANAVVILCLAASCLGFLRFNFHPAKVFMGDSGSMFIGYIIAISGLMSSQKSATVSSILIPMLAAGVPLFDTFLAIWRRFVRKLISGKSSTSIMGADSEHLHHRLLRDNKQHQVKTVFIIYGLAVFFGVLALLTMFLKDRTPALAFIITMLTIVVIIRRIATIELWHSATVIVSGLNKPRKKLFFVLIPVFLDFYAIVFAFILSHILFTDKISENGIIETINQSLIFTLVIIVSFVIFRVYRRLWINASANDYAHLVEVLLGAHCVNFFLLLFFKDFQSSFYIGKYLFFFFASTMILLLERMMLYYINAHFTKLIQSRHESGQFVKVLLFGTNGNAKSYIQQVMYCKCKQRVEIRGLISEDPLLWKQFIHGVKVCGNFETVVSKKEKIDFEKIVITINIDDDYLNELKKLCLRNGIKLSKFIAEEETLIDSPISTKYQVAPCSELSDEFHGVRTQIA